MHTIHVATTRFNNQTVAENRQYRTHHQLQAIYGSHVKITERCPVGTPLFVIEMNNDKNEIEGIGFIYNRLALDRRYAIYANDQYNQYVYRGRFWLNRESILQFNAEWVRLIESMLFKGRSHVKRQGGISLLTAKLLQTKSIDMETLRDYLVQMFRHYQFHVCPPAPTPAPAPAPEA